MRFFIDHNMDAAVGTRLRQLGHEAWTADDAALAGDQDDQLTVYAMDRRAVLITHDGEFTERRKSMPFGHHIRLKCAEWEAADLLETMLPSVMNFLGQNSITIVLSPGGHEPNIRVYFGTEGA